MITRKGYFCTYFLQVHKVLARSMHRYWDSSTKITVDLLDFVLFTQSFHKERYVV